jgi:Tfp pilus assembly protein PilF
MSTNLVIQQESGAEFQVTRTAPFKTSKPVKVPSPYTWPVEGRPNSNLMVELQWYLERFLEYPFPPETEHAGRILDALKSWGEQAFEALFGNLSGGSLFQAATAADYSRLNLQIASNHAGVLSWPWEALRDPRLGTALAQACRIERRLSEILDAPAVSPSLPKDRVNILLVVARPYGDRDVRYRSIARSLVELIQKHNLPAHVDLLRPPTFAQLREHLKQHPNYYHILHFDGHGAYAPSAATPSQHSYQSVEGKIVFETDEGEADPITAAQLNDLLRDYAVPGVVLNACQSAMVAQESGDAFSSVAAALLRSGAASVLAMAYSLYVSGAQEFLPAFYRSLFETGSMAEAARAGRQQMRAQRKRLCARGKYELEDWLLPVLYQQAEPDLSFAAKATVPKVESRLPEEFRSEKNPYGFIGRDSALLALERAMLRPPAGILIQGLGGVGKTTLARGFVRWLEDTNGLGKGAFWLDFRGIRSADYVLNRIGEPFFGPNFGSGGADARLEVLVKALRERRFVIVWDNFESASGIAGTSVTANLPDADRALLAQFLDGLRGGASKVLITSRSEENWLGPQRRWKLPLGGFDGEERWEYCETVVRDLGLTVNRTDKDYADLMSQLAGHPLAMRVVLPQLENHSATEIARALRGNLAALKPAAGDEASEQLFAALRFVEDALPESLRPLLEPLSLHEAFVDLDYLEEMAKQVPGNWSRSQIDQLAGALANAGLLQDRGQAIYELHPALTGYLRSQPGKPGSVGAEEWTRAFVDVMGTLADSLTRRKLHEQRVPFYLHGANFHTALAEAERLAMEADEKLLTWCLGMWALNTRDLPEAERLFLQLARHEDAAAVAYHQLGMVAQERRDLAAAEQWYLRALAINERLGNERAAAITYHQLGSVALERRDLAAAEQWYFKSLAIKERHGDERGAASTYHQLGRVAEERREFATAEQWYLKSLAIKEKQGNEHGAASTYHNLGFVVQEQRDFAAAEQWYLKSLAISEKQGDEHYAATTYHQLGIMAQERHDFAAAEQWYLKSLAIEERQGNEHGAATTYHQLGMVAQQRRDFAAAEQWYLKSLSIKEKLGNEHGAATTYHQLGRVAAEQQRPIEAGHLFARALAVFRKNDPHNAQIATASFTTIHQAASPDEQRQLEALWSQAGLGPFPPPENS